MVGAAEGEAVGGWVGEEAVGEVGGAAVGMVGDTGVANCGVTIGVVLALQPRIIAVRAAIRRVRNRILLMSFSPRAWMASAGLPGGEAG
jgi:hypothetical protein